MREGLEAAKQAGIAEIQAWAKDALTGRPATAETLALFEAEARQRMARHLDVPVDRVKITNLRYVGGTLALDGFELNLD